MTPAERLLLEKYLKGSFVLSIKADGPCVGDFSLLEVALVNMFNQELNFSAQLRPMSSSYDPKFLSSQNLTREECKSFQNPQTVFEDLNKWIEFIKKQFALTSLEIWSEDPSFQSQWIHYYSYKYLKSEPLGLTHRSIPDFIAGNNYSFQDISLNLTGSKVNFPSITLPTIKRAKKLAKLMEVVFLRQRYVNSV